MLLRSLIGELAPQAMIHDTINPFRWRWIRGFSKQEQSYIASKMSFVLIHWFLLSPLPVFMAVKMGPNKYSALIYVGYFVIAFWVCFSVVLNWQREHYGKAKTRIIEKKNKKPTSEGES